MSRERRCEINRQEPYRCMAEVRKTARELQADDPEERQNKYRQCKNTISCAVDCDYCKVHAKMLGATLHYNADLREWEGCGKLAVEACRLSDPKPKFPCKKRDTIVWNENDLDVLGYRNAPEPEHAPLTQKQANKEWKAKYQKYREGQKRPELASRPMNAKIGFASSLERKMPIPHREDAHEIWLPSQSQPKPIDKAPWPRKPAFRTSGRKRVSGRKRARVQN